MSDDHRAASDHRFTPEALRRIRVGGFHAFDPARPAAMVAAWVARTEPTSPEVRLAQQATHDDVINYAGEQRTSGVTWVIRSGVDAVEAVAALHEQLAADDPMADHLERIMGKLEERGGGVVVAMVNGRT